VHLLLHTRKVIVLLLSIVISTIAMAPAPAFAFFHASASATASAKMAALAAPENVRAEVASGATTVHVTWSPASPPPGAVLDGYRVSRIENGSTANACATAPTKFLGATTNACDDVNVADGTYTYQVIAVFRSWTRTSAAGAPVHVERDVTAPSADITFPVDDHTYGAGQFGTGCATAGFCGTASDANGVASVDIAYLDGTGRNWDGHNFVGGPEILFRATLATPGAATTSWAFPIAAPADGTYFVKVRATDVFGNALPSGWYAAKASMHLDTTAPTVTKILFTNGGTNGRADQNDTIAVTFSEAVSVASICSTWTGDTANHSLTGTNDVTVTIANNGANDRLTASATSCALTMGTISLGADYTASTATFKGSSTSASTLSWDATTHVLTIKLGALSGSVLSSVAGGKPAYTAPPSPGITDLAGNRLVAGFTETTNRVL
jgi:hypothetical protein